MLPRQAENDGGFRRRRAQKDASGVQQFEGAGDEEALSEMPDAPAQEHDDQADDEDGSGWGAEPLGAGAVPLGKGNEGRPGMPGKVDAGAVWLGAGAVWLGYGWVCGY